VRIPLILISHSGRSRSPIPVILIMHSGGSRSSVPVIPIIPEMTAPTGRH
jgi:hypothetical protein